MILSTLNSRARSRIEREFLFARQNGIKRGIYVFLVSLKRLVGCQGCGAILAGGATISPMSSNPKLPDELHDLLNALRQKSAESTVSETERLLIATVLKLADELAELRMKLRRVV